MAHHHKIRNIDRIRELIGLSGPGIEILREDQFAPYCQGSGLPTFTLHLLDTGLKTCDGKWRLAYVLEEIHQGKRETVFIGADFGCSPMHAIDSDETVRSLMTFLTLRPGDTDSDYFNDYTDRQLLFCSDHAEALSCFMLDWRKERLTFDEVLQLLNEERHVEPHDVQPRVLDRQAWLAEWHFFGCMSESRAYCRSKSEAIEAACSYADGENGVPRGMKADLRRHGCWSGPAFGSESDVQNTTISAHRLGDLLS